MKFYDRGKFRSDILDAFLTNVRVPRQTGIDMKALMGAVWIGRERAEALIRHYGKEQVKAIHAAQIAASERAFRERLAGLPDGIYKGASHMEHDGVDDRVYTIRATVTKEGETLRVDFTGTDAQAPGALNCTDVGAVGNVIAAIGTVLAPDIPFNAGLLDPVEIEAPPGTLVNAVKPAPISAATVYAAWFGTDAILEALNYLIAGNDATEHRRTGPWGCWTFAWLQSPNQYGEPWFWNVFTGGAGGAGALPFRDGENAMLGIQTVDAFSPNIEEYELQSPVLFLSSNLAPDTGGAGKFRGGLAPQSLCIPYEVDGWDIAVFQNRMSTPASAVSGGYPGAGSSIAFARHILDDVKACWSNRAALPLADYVADAERPPARARGFRLNADDGYYIRATGGPGYGDPMERDPEAVATDVRRGFVTLPAGRDVYGVVLDESTGAVDGVATESLRDEARRERARWPLGTEVLPVGDGSGGLPEPREPVSPRAQLLGESLEIDADGWYRCRRCSHRFASNMTNWKWWAACSQACVEPASIFNTIAVRSRGELVIRCYCCPECSTQIDTEIAFAEEPPRWNFRPLQATTSGAGSPDRVD